MKDTLDIQTVVMIGDLGGGFEASGPFPSWEAAQTYADEHCVDGPPAYLIDVVAPWIAALLDEDEAEDGVE